MVLPMPHISIVVPVYLGEACLRELYTRLCAVLTPITPNFEIVLVEDRSPDESWAVVRQLCAEDPRVVGLRLSRNFGQHPAITAGMERARGEWVVVMDCDLQDPPEAIPLLYARAQQGFHVVVAARTQRKEGLIKRGMSAAFYWVFNQLADVPYNGRCGNFRIMSRRTCDAFIRLRESSRLFGPMVDWLGFSRTEIDVEQAPRFAGESSYTFGKLLALAMDGITSFSDRPLRISIKFGALIAGGSLLFMAFILVKALVVGIPVEGWSSLMVTVTLMSGIIIANMGVIGLYLGKTFREVKGRPVYIIDDVAETPRPVEHTIRPAASTDVS